MTESDLLYHDITRLIIEAAYKVYNKLGAGFLEKVYENALLIELKKKKLKVLQQYPIEISYDGVVIGEYFADIVVNDKIIIELKAVSELSKAHEVQLVNYLKATKMQVGLLINFGNEINIKRKIMQNK